MSDEIEAIRARHKTADARFVVQGITLDGAAIPRAHADRATLLRLLDAALAEVDRLEDALDEIAAHYNGGITGPGRLQADSMRDIARAALAKDATT